MRTENEKIVKAVCQFVANAHQNEEIQDLPNNLQHLFNLFLETEQANDPKVRLLFLKSIATVTQLAKALEPFTKQQVQTACNAPKY